MVESNIDSYLGKILHNTDVYYMPNSIRKYVLPRQQVIEVIKLDFWKKIQKQLLNNLWNHWNLEIFVQVPLL